MKKILFALLFIIPLVVFPQATGKVINDKVSGGSIGSAATTVDVFTTFNLNQTTAGQTLTIPNLTNASAGKIIYVNNVGSVQLTLSPGGILPIGYGVVLRWTGASWSVTAPPTDLTDIETHLDSLSANKVAYSDTVSTIATHTYIDSLLSGVAEPAVFFADAGTAAALPAVTYSSGTLTATSNGRIANIDGVKLEIDNFLLVKNQVAGLQNGYYQVIDTGTASTPFILARPIDYNETAEIYPSVVNVSQGTSNGSFYFTQTTVDPVIGTSALVYTLGSRPPSANYPIKFSHVYTETALPNSPTYASGSNLIYPAYAATLTATTNGAFPTLQGVAPRVGLVVLVGYQTDSTKNGSYKILVKGSATTKWKIQRVDYSAALLQFHIWFILEGTGKYKLYTQNNKSLINLNIGTSGNITFTEVRSFLNTVLTGTTTATAVNTTSLTATTASVTTTSTASITATASSIVPTMSYPSNTTNSASTEYVTTALAAIPVSAGILGIANASGVYTYYATYTLAMAAATAGQTIEQFADITETGAVQITYKDGVNIDGHGHSYTLSNAGAYNAFTHNTAGGLNMSINNLRIIRTTVGYTCFVIGATSTGTFDFSGSVFYATVGAGLSVTGNVKVYNLNAINGSASGSCISVTAGALYNCVGTSGTQEGIYSEAALYNCIGQSGSGKGITSAAGTVIGCTGISTSSYGLYVIGGDAIDSKGVSTSSYGIWEDNTATNVTNCTGVSVSGTGIQLARNKSVTNLTAISSSGYAVRMGYDGYTLHNLTAISTTSAAVLADANWHFYGGCFTSLYNNAVGYAITGNGGATGVAVGTIVGVTLKCSNASAPYIYNNGTAIIIKMKDNNFIGGAATNANITSSLYGRATLVAGTLVVNTTAVTAISNIRLTAQTLGTITVPVGYAVSARTAATSFTILSGDLTDTSIVAWEIEEPNN